MSVWKKVLNLPEAPAQEDGDETPTKVDQHAEVAPGWTMEREPRRDSWRRNVGRTLVFGTVALLALLGVRSLFVRPAEPEADERTTFPVQAAQATASRFAATYLASAATDDERRARTAMLALDIAGGASVKTDWSGSAGATVGQVVPGALQVSEDGQRAAVTVLVLMQRPKSAASKPADEPAEPAAQWVGLSVPVVADQGRVGVSASPAFVALPSPPEVKGAPSDAADDTATATETRDGAEAFFRAFAGTDAAALEQATAPGAHIEPVGGAVTFVSLDAWDVAEGSPDERAARALVTWEVAGATIQQSYRLTLSAISAGGDRSWRVQSVTADLNP